MTSTVVNVDHSALGVDQTENEERNSSIDCNLCLGSSQHICRKCCKPVCNLFCSIQDPSSDNDQHRIHKDGDPRCKKFTQNLQCPKCYNSFHAKENLDFHLESEHSRFEDYSELELTAEGSLSDAYLKCSKCNSSFENEYDLERHRESFHGRLDSTKKRESNSIVDYESSQPKKKKEKFICKLCDKTFSRKDSLTRHNENKH